MAKYTRLLRSIWTNPDFVALPSPAQRLYLLLISQPDITAAGVLPLMERRWSRLAPDTDADSVRAGLDELEQGRFVLTDASTDEVWVRSYLAVDELWKVPNGRKSIAAAYEAVTSSLLKAQIVTVLETLAGWVPETVRQREGPPQQPAAASLSLSVSNTSSRSRNPSANGHPEPHSELPAAAAAALDLLIAHRLAAEPDIRNAKRYAAKIRNDETALHGSAMTERCTWDADPEHIAEHILGLTRSQVITASVHLERNQQ